MAGAFSGGASYNLFLSYNPTPLAEFLNSATVTRLPIASPSIQLVFHLHMPTKRSKIMAGAGSRRHTKLYDLLCAILGIRCGRQRRADERLVDRGWLPRRRVVQLAPVLQRDPAKRAPQLRSGNLAPDCIAVNSAILPVVPGRAAGLGYVLCSDVPPGVRDHRTDLLYAAFRNARSIEKDEEASGTLPSFLHDFLRIHFDEEASGTLPSFLHDLLRIHFETNPCTFPSAGVRCAFFGGIERATRPAPRRRSFTKIHCVSLTRLVANVSPSLPRARARTEDDDAVPADIFRKCDRRLCVATTAQATAMLPLYGLCFVHAHHARGYPTPAFPRRWASSRTAVRGQSVSVLLRPNALRTSSAPLRTAPSLVAPWPRPVPLAPRWNIPRGNRRVA